MPTAPVLQAVGLCRTFRQGDARVAAVADVDFDARTAELVAIVGPSGSGKSTLLHLLGGLDRPDSGRVLLDGRAISALPERELAVLRRRRLGFLLQEQSLLPTLTALENVAFPLLLDGVQDALARAEAQLAQVGLERRGEHRSAQLSGGELQRVALARALVPQPAVLLADEPTGSLDSAAGRQILDLLRAAADRGQATVVVTHDQRIEALADRVVRLVDGRLVEGARTR